MSKEVSGTSLGNRSMNLKSRMCVRIIPLYYVVRNMVEVQERICATYDNVQLSRLNMVLWKVSLCLGKQFYRAKSNSFSTLCCRKRVYVQRRNVFRQCFVPFVKFHVQQCQLLTSACFSEAAVLKAKYTLKWSESTSRTTNLSLPVPWLRFSKIYLCQCLG